MTDEASPQYEDRNFYDAQGFGGDKYFMYVIDQNGQTSCYFWFSGPAQLLNAIKEHMDFWGWRDGWSEAAEALEKIINAHPNPTLLDGSLCAQINSYIEEHAGLRIWAWGTFEDLTCGSQAFSVEVRSEFREAISSADWADDSSSLPSAEPARPIGATELEDFIEYLYNTTT